MNKVLITVYVPYLEKQYEVFIPISKRIHTIISLLAKAINELSADEFKVRPDYVLYNKKTGKSDLKAANKYFKNLKEAEGIEDD